MDGNSLLGQCMNCCDPCHAPDNWPDTIFITISGVSDCGCINLGGIASENITPGMNTINGTWTLTRTASNPSAFSNGFLFSVLESFFTDTACTIPDPSRPPQTVNIGLSFTVFNSGAGDCPSSPPDSCCFQIFANLGGFDSGLLPATTNILQPFANTRVCTSSGFGFGGFATISV